MYEKRYPNGMKAKQISEDTEVGLS
jgi:hypothetical protein